MALSFFLGSVHDGNENPLEAELGLLPGCCCCCWSPPCPLLSRSVSIVDWLMASSPEMVGCRIARLMSSRICRSFTMLAVQSGLCVTCETNRRCNEFRLG